MRALLALAFLLLAAVPVLGVQPDEMLADPALEARAREISEGLRCLVCQNQSIEESDADLARDLRIIVRERVMAGDTDQQAVDFVVARYGEYVLLKPVFALHTLLLWIAGPAILLIGAIAIALAARRKPVVEPASALSADEASALDDLQK